MKGRDYRAAGMSAGSEVLCCHNLRLGADGVLRPVGTPRAVEGASGATPLRQLPADGTLLSLRGATLLAGTRIVGSLPAPLLCHLPADDGSTLLVTADGSTLTLDPDALELTPRPPLRGPFALTAVATGEIGGTVSAIGFRSLYYGHSTTLTDADASSLRQALNSAYASLATQATRLKCGLQPMIGYYTLHDAEGRLLYRSCPVVVGPPAGLNCLDSVGMTLRYDTASTAFTGCSASELRATVFKPALRLIVDPADEQYAPLLNAAAQVRVHLSPQMHPWQASASPGHRLESTGAQAGRLTCRLPGTSLGMTPLPTSQESRALAVMQMLDEAVHTVWQAQCSSLGLEAPGDTANIDLEAQSSPSADIRLLDSLVSRAARLAADTAGAHSGAAALLERCSIPHTFMARAAGRSASTAVWADISPRLFDGYSAAEMGRDVDTGMVTTLTVSHLGDERVVASYTGLGCAPATLSPLLCYPLASATAMTVAAESAASGTRSLTVALRTLPGCPYAFYLSPSLAPLEPEALATQLTLPAERRSERRYPGMALTADAAHPLRPLGAVAASPGAVRGVVPVMRGATGWDFSRERFILLTADGMHNLAVGHDATPGAPSRIIDGDFTGAWARRGMALWALTDEGHLVELSSSRAAIVDRDVTAVGYCAALDELWRVRAGAVTVTNCGIDNSEYVRPDLGVAALHQLGSALYVATRSGRLLDASAEDTPASVWVEWSRRARLESRVRHLEARLDGAGVSGRLRVLADGGPGLTASVPMLTLHIDGDINAPLRARLVAPPRRWVTVNWQGAVGPLFQLEGVTLSF